MPKTCLLLEDDFVLRSMTEAMLVDLGVPRIAAFADISETLEFLASEARPDFALVDYRLGRLTTSEPVALKLLRLGVPMVFVTGLGELPELEGALADVPVLEKPLQREDLLPLLTRAGLVVDHPSTQQIGE